MRIPALVWMVVVGCAGSPMSHDPHAGQFELTFHNEAGSAVCALHIFPEGDPAEGDSWLDAGTEVASGRFVAFWLQPGTYQVRAVGCSREKLQVTGYAPQVIMNRSGVVVLYREDVPSSVEAADALAHDHQNSTRMPAKLTANKSAAKTK
jgi:hypothetical protein